MTRGFLHSFNRSVSRSKLFGILVISIVISLTTLYNCFDTYSFADISVIVRVENATEIGAQGISTITTSSSTTLPSSSSTETEAEVETILPPQEVIKDASQLYSRIFQIIKDAAPELPVFNKYKSNERIPNIRFDDRNSKTQFSKEYLSNFLQISDEELTTMKALHSSVVSSFKNITTENVYKGNGIVYVGGGKFNWLALLSIKSLRNIGSELPVEVLIPTEKDYEPELCEKILPSLRAKCLYLPEILGNETMSMLSFGGYQYKSLALLVSSFSNVLLLDADNLPVYVPDVIFNNKPFTSKGLVVWPDFWKRSTSPDFYTIADINVSDQRALSGFTDNDKKYTPLHQLKGSLLDPTSESGQVLLNKKTHLHDMFLTLYYNSYGPSYYYPLLSQGVLGEGDKETFLAASVALKNTFFQVRRSVHAVGRFKKDGAFVGTAMGQFDPIQDYLNAVVPKEEKKGPKMLFIHANFPKLHPVILKEQRKLFEGSQRVRMFGPELIRYASYDFELFQFRNMEHLLCDLRFELDAFKGHNRTTICEELREHVVFLENDRV